MALSKVADPSFDLTTTNGLRYDQETCHFWMINDTISVPDLYTTHVKSINSVMAKCENELIQSHIESNEVMMRSH